MADAATTINAPEAYAKAVRAGKFLGTVCPGSKSPKARQGSPIAATPTP